MERINSVKLAKNLAHAIMGDIVHHEGKLIIQAINNDDFFELMHAHIEEGRAHFNSRVSDEIAASKIYDLAICNILVRYAYKHRTSTI
ncbi:MAG: hypothetical protein LWW87_07100 [Geobacteraceae bacterium]|nr:hypothetical protein [Geobacteraceae bacterium]